MQTELILSVENAVVSRAQEYAARTGSNLSEIVERYLAKLSDEKHTKGLSPPLKKIVGVVSLPENFDKEKELRAAYERKHL